MHYDFVCDSCDGPVQTVRAPMSEGPTPPVCPLHGQMRRIYGDHQTTIYHRNGDLVDMAYRGETSVPGLTNAQVRAMVDSENKHRTRGQANRRAYRTLR